MDHMWNFSEAVKTKGQIWLLLKADAAVSVHFAPDFAHEPLTTVSGFRC